MPIDYRIAIAVLVIAVLWYYIDNRWCWTCKRISAYTGWWPVEVRQSALLAKSGENYFFVLKERRKQCDSCGTCEVIDATSSLANQYEADMYRDDINREAISANE